MSALYAQMVSVLSTVLPNDLVASTQNGYPVTAWTQSARLAVADAVAACKEYERQAIVLIEEVLARW